MVQGPRREQQDYVKVVRGVNEADDILVLVADGHRQDGAELAKLVCDRFARAVKEEGLDPTDETLLNTFLDQEDDRLGEYLAEERLWGGTTLLVVYVRYGMMFSALVGDGDVCLVHSSMRYTNWTPHKHNVWNKDEVRRMQSYGYRLDGGDEERWPVDPYFIGPPGLKHRFQLSRSLGDHDHGEAMRAQAICRSGVLHAGLGGTLLVATDGVIQSLVQGEEMRMLHSLGDEHDSFYERAESFCACIREIAVENASGVMVDLRSLRAPIRPLHRRMY